MIRARLARAVCATRKMDAAVSWLVVVVAPAVRWLNRLLLLFWAARQDGHWGVPDDCQPVHNMAWDDQVKVGTGSHHYLSPRVAVVRDVRADAAAGLGECVGHDHRYAPHASCVSASGHAVQLYRHPALSPCRPPDPSACPLAEQVVRPIPKLTLCALCRPPCCLRVMPRARLCSRTAHSWMRQHWKRLWWKPPHHGGWQLYFRTVFAGTEAWWAAC